MSTELVEGAEMPVVALTKRETDKLERRALSLYTDAQRTTVLLAVELRRLQEGGAHLLRGYANFGDYVEATFEGISKPSAQQISRQGQVLLLLAAEGRCSIEGRGENLPGTTGVRALAVILNRYGPEAMLAVYDAAVETGRGVIAETVAAGVAREIDAARPELGEGDGGAGSEDDPDAEPGDDDPDHGYDDDADEDTHELRDRLGMLHDILHTIGDAAAEGNRAEAEHQFDALRDELPQLYASIERAMMPAHGPGCKELDAGSASAPGEKRFVCVANCPRKLAQAERA
jgi:hypothetical protein